MTMVGRALTDRELELVRLLALGYTNDEAAARLQVAPATVRTRINKIAEKMDLAIVAEPGGQRAPGVLRAQIVQRAYRLGLIA